MSAATPANLEPLAALPSGDRQLHLTGFMGSGKSTVGQSVARRLLWNFLDLDAVVARQVGKTVAAIFAEDGEPVFRELEARVLRQVVEKPRTVVALGGGTLLAAANRERCQAAATLVWLRCGIDEIERRSADPGRGRPLWGDRGELEALLAARRPGYEAASVQIDAVGDPEVVATRVLEALEVAGR